jgi:hypothetical protein
MERWLIDQRLTGMIVAGCRELHRWQNSEMHLPSEFVGMCSEQNR